jgi:hypothetical protein
MKRGGGNRTTSVRFRRTQPRATGWANGRDMAFGPDDEVREIVEAFRQAEQRRRPRCVVPTAESLARRADEESRGGDQSE